MRHCAKQSAASVPEGRKLGGTGGPPVVSGGSPETSRGASGKAVGLGPGLARSGAGLSARLRTANPPLAPRGMFPAGRRKPQAIGLFHPLAFPPAHDYSRKTPFILEFVD